MKPTPEDGFYFVSVGGSKVEIARIHKGLMYSTGCADAHPLDGVELIQLIHPAMFPQTEKQKTAEKKRDERLWEQRRKDRIASGLPAYGYRKFE